MTWDGLKACKTLTDDGHMVNVTLCFSANQAILAAKAGATFISPFIGRLDDINLDGMDLIADIRTIYDNYGFETQILAASIRSANHMSQAALIGADVATAPPEVIRKMADTSADRQGARRLFEGCGGGRDQDRLRRRPVLCALGAWDGIVQIHRTEAKIHARALK